MIVCATRGGEASRVAQDHAIQLAKQGDEELVFFYVADTGVLEHTSDTRPHEIARNLSRMGEFILTIAQERAQEAGFQKVSWVCRLGTMREELKAYLLETGADKLVLGRPVAQGVEQVFTQTGLDEFAAELEADTGVQVFMADTPVDEDER
jgi:nucleotide-binding universal stress UspA family protein